MQNPPNHKQNKWISRKNIDTIQAQQHQNQEIPQFDTPKYNQWSKENKEDTYHHVQYFQGGEDDEMLKQISNLSLTALETSQQYPLRNHKTTDESISAGHDIFDSFKYTKLSTKQLVPIISNRTEQPKQDNKLRQVKDHEGKKGVAIVQSICLLLDVLNQQELRYILSQIKNAV